MNTKRIFLGTYFKTDDFLCHYDEIKNDFENVTKGKWVEIENLHFTYQFLGDVQVNIVPKIIASLRDCLTFYSFPLELKGLGCFPNQQRPNVLFANIIDSQKILPKIHSEMDKILLDYGFEPEKRKFTPHLTLQRLKFADNDLFKKNIEKFKDVLFAEQTGFEVNMLESKLTPAGPIYTIID